jgi:hypothetical protein
MKSISYYFICLLFFTFSSNLTAQNYQFKNRNDGEVLDKSKDETVFVKKCSKKWESFCANGLPHILPETQKVYEMMKEIYPQCDLDLKVICEKSKRDEFLQKDYIKIQKEKEYSRLIKTCNNNLRLSQSSIEYLSTIVKVHPNLIEIKRFEVDYREEYRNNRITVIGYCKLIFYSPKGADSIDINLIN